MDQLNENLLELKRRVDARVEQMLILGRAQAAETQALATSDVGSPGMLEDHSDLDFEAHMQPVLILPQGDDPTVAYSDEKAFRPDPLPGSASSQLEDSTAMLSAAERVADRSLVEIANTSAEHDPTPTVSQEGIRAHPPAIRRQGFLHRVFGRLLARKF